MNSESCFDASNDKEPGTFPCVVNGKLLTAEVIESQYTLIEYTFKIKFSDGTQIEAIFTESAEWWLSEEWWRPYFEAVEIELYKHMSAHLQNPTNG